MQLNFTPPTTGQPLAQQQPGLLDKVGGFVSGVANDAANTLLVTPAARATEAITRTLAPNSLAAKGYNAMADEGQGQSFSSPVGNINVPAQKAFGQGGAEQIGGQALKSASYLAPAVAAEGLPTVGMAGSGIAKGVIGGATQGVKLGAVGGVLGGAGNAMSQGGSATDVATQGLQGAGTGALIGGAIGGATGLAGNVWNWKNSDSYTTNLQNADTAQTQAGAAATDSIHEASNVQSDVKTGIQNQFGEVPNMISKVDPNAGTTISPSTLQDMQSLKETKAWSLPNSVKDAIPTDINGPIKFTPQQTQDIITSLNDLKYNSKGDVVVNQQTSKLISDFKNAAQEGMGHVTDNLGNSIWAKAYQDYHQTTDAMDAMSNLIPTKKFSGGMLDPTEVTKSTQKIMKMMETKDGLASLMKSNEQYKAATGYDILNDPMGTIQKLADSNNDFAKALKGNYGHQFVQQLKNPSLAARRTAMAITTVLGIVSLGTAFRKQIGSFISGQ